MRRNSVLFFSTVAIFSLIISAIILPPVFATNTNCSQHKNCQNNSGKGSNNDRPNISHNVSARSGNKNQFNGNSNSHASVKNDNSVHIQQNTVGSGNRPDLNRNKNHKNNNHKNNNGNKKNDHDKKVVKKDIDKTVNETVVIRHETPQVIIPPVTNNNVNENVNENVNINENRTEVVRHETVYVDRPVVQEVASYQDYTVYPVQEVTVTPDTGAESLAFFSLPFLSGVGLILRRKFSV